MTELSDADVFGAQAAVELSDDEVFGQAGNVGFDDRILQKDGMFPESPTGNEQGLTELNALSLPLALIGKAVAGVANPVYNLLTGHDPEAKRMVFDTRIGSPEHPVQEVGPRFQAGQTVFRDPNWVNPLRDDNAVNRGLNALWQGMTTPEGLATAGAGGVGAVAKAGNLPRLAQTLNIGAKTGGASFIGDMLAHAPETTAQAAGSVGTYVGTPEEQRTKEMSDQMKDALVQEAFNKFFLGTAGVHGVKSYRDWKAKQPIEPEIVDPTQPNNNFSREIKGMLEAPKESVIDLENVGGVYRAPADIAKQIEGQKRQFVTDEMGQTIPREQFDPTQGQDALSHRQPLQGYRPAPPVIETPEVQIQNTLKSIEAKLNEFVQAQKPEPTIVPAWQASGQPKQGGQISFEAPAAAGAVPSARQSGVPDIRGGATGELIRMGDDAASLPAREKMIKPEGQSSGVRLKAPQIEDGKSIAEQLGIRYDGRQEMIPGKPKEVYTSQDTGNPFTLYVEPGTGMAEVKSRLEEKQKVHQEMLNEKPLNPGGSEASLTPELQKKSKENNSLAAFAKSNGVEYVEGDTGPMILKKIQEKQSSKSTVESDKLLPENFTHILGNIQQKVKFAEGLGDITKAQADKFRARGDAIFEQSHTDPAGAREQAKKLNDEVRGSKKDPRTGGDLYGGLFFLDPKFWKDNFGKNSHVAHDAKQLYNLLRNKMNEKSQAWKELDVAEFREFMKEGGKRTPSEVEAWVKQHAQGVRLKEEASPLTLPSTSKGIGGGIKSAVEKNREAGAIVNPFRKVNRPLKSSEFQDVQQFKTYADEVFDSTQPHGVGRIPGFSRLFDPRAYRTTPDGEAIIANAVMSQKGQNFSALWQERQRDVQRVFEVDDKGTFTDVSGRRAYMSDVIEAELRAPGSQSLTAGQKTFINEWKSLRKKIVDRATAEGVQFFVDDHGNIVPINENYFPRPAVGKEGIVETVRENVRKAVGGKQSFMKGRQYETEAEGVKAGIKYEPDEFARIGRWMASVYKAIADTRLANDPLMQGRKQGRPKFLEEGQVFQPAFSGRIFPKDVAARLNRYYGEQPYNWLRAVSSVNDNLKALQFTLDVSAPFNQGLPLMGVNPARWAKATSLSWKALLDDRVVTKYLKDPTNAKAAKTILENNGSLVRLQDFLAGAGEGRALHNVAPIRASGRSMGTFLTVAKIELFKAFEPIADAKGWSKTELVEAVENAVLSGKMEMLGLSQGRAMGERLLANAPSYIRGAVNLTAMAGQGKISGRVARRAIVGMGVAISAIMYGLYKASEMSDDEIEKRFDPRNPNFYRYPHLLGNGQRQEISFGNIMISLARLAGTSVDTLTGKKDYGPGTKGDPWLRWLSYRKSPVAGLALTMYTGEDYRGEPIGKVEAALRSLMPVSMEPMFDKAQESEKKVLGVTESKATGVGAQLFGLNTFNESKGAFRSRQQEEIAQREYGKSFKELDSIDRTFVVEEAKSLTDKTIDTKTTPRQVMNIVTDTEKRRTSLTKSLSAENQDWLKKHRLEVTSYQESMSINKRELKLADDEEKERLKKFMSEETEEAITTLRENGGEPDQERVNKRLELAHKRAWRKLRDAVGK